MEMSNVLRTRVVVKPKVKVVITKIEDYQIDYDEYVSKNEEELKTLLEKYKLELFFNGEILDPDGEYFQTYFSKFLEKIDTAKNPKERINLEYIFDYLINKENMDIINQNISEFKKYHFKPNIDIYDYLEYAEKNYKILLFKSFKKYQQIKNRLESEPTYLYKLSEWAQENIKTNKEEYYKKTFLVEYLENILIKKGRTLCQSK